MLRPDGLAEWCSWSYRVARLFHCPDRVDIGQRGGTGGGRAQRLQIGVRPEDDVRTDLGGGVVGADQREDRGVGVLGAGVGRLALPPELIVRRLLAGGAAPRPR